MSAIHSAGWYEAEGDYVRAANLYKVANDRQGFERCLIKQNEIEKQFAAFEIEICEISAPR